MKSNSLMQFRQTTRILRTMRKLHAARLRTASAWFVVICSLTIGTAVFGAEGADTEAQEPTAAATDFEWSDFTVKAYTLTAWGGSFSGTTYLENQLLGPRTVLTDGEADINAYAGGVLFVSRDTRHYEAATKKINPGTGFGGRVGIYIADDFHLDLLGSYAAGEATTSMMYTPDPDRAPDVKSRIIVDTDPGFKVYRGGLGLLYDANSTAIFGVVPRIGFGLGGVINRFSVLQDETALYLEGSLGLKYHVTGNLDLSAQADLTTFAFQVAELGYSNMVHYTTYSLGLTWFIDRVPPPVRAAHNAAKVDQ